MRQDQTLPVAVEYILRAARTELQTAPLRQRFQQQMHLGIMAQRLIMSHALDRLRDRFTIGHGAAVKADIIAEARCYLIRQNLKLHRAHELHIDRAAARIPFDMELRILRFERLQMLHRLLRLNLIRQQHAVAHDRCQHRLARIRTAAESAACIRRRKPRHRADCARLGFIPRHIFRTGIKPDARDFFGIFVMIRTGIADLIAVMQRTAAQLEIGQTVSLCIRGDFEHLRAEFCRSGRLLRISRQDLKQRFHALEVTRRTEADRKDLPCRDRITQHLLRQCIRLKIDVHQILGAGGGMLADRIIVRIKLHAALRQSAL